MGQLEPCTCEGVREFLWVLLVTPCDRLVPRVVAKGEVCRGHHRPVLLGRVVCVNYHVLFSYVLGQPLISSGRALNQFPLIIKQRVQITHVPFSWVRFPGTLDTTTDCVTVFSATEAAFPT